MKASFEAIHMGVQSHEFSIGRELAGAAQSAIAGTSFGPDHAAGIGGPPKRKKSKSTDQTVLDVVSASSHGFLDDSLIDPDLNMDLRDQDWNFDPNEPRYCICNQVSYGDMVACDNEDVRIRSSFEPVVSITFLKAIFIFSVHMNGSTITASE